MAGRKHILGRFRLVYRRSSPLLKTVVLVTIILGAVTLTALGIAHNQELREQEALKEQIAQLQQENQQVKNDIAQLGSVQSILRIAMEKLGLAKPGTILFETIEGTNPD